MRMRFALSGIVALGLIVSAFASKAVGSISQGKEVPQTTMQAFKGVRVGQADGSKKCPEGFYWTCSKFGCSCQQKGRVY